MQLASIILAAAAAVVAVAAQETPAPVVATTTMPDGNAKVTLPPDTTTPGATPAAAGAGAAPASGGGVGVAAYKASPTTDAYHMAPVRVVHARVQSDSPILVEGQLVSSFGKGKLDAGYLSSLDSVNTASVEGALMYVQAETINVATRAAKERCVRKTKVANVVFYEILIAQTNETIAQFQDDWSTPEYGPMLAFDGGKCSATEGDKLPAECYQFNGQKDQPNVGPFVGGTNKELSDRAPYPGNYWFSFPNTCPTESWADKTADCRKTTRMGLCPVGVAPNGVDCTFAYSILGWVPIDDVVGITSFANSATGKSFTNFTQWCEASEDNVEFSYDLASKTVKTALPFWEKPLDTDANANRTQVMLDTYAALLTKGSSQVSPAVAKAFRALPKPEELAKTNPPCYKTVAKCGSGNGCKRTGYSQLCVECKAGEKCPTSDGTFTFPKLVKAFTTLPAEETKTNLTPAPEGVNDDKSVTGGNAAGGSKANGTTTDKTGSAAATVSVAFATAAASVLLALAL